MLLRLATNLVALLPHVEGVAFMPASWRRSVRGSSLMTGEHSFGLLTAEIYQCEDCGYLSLGVHVKGLLAFSETRGRNLMFT